MSLCPLKIVYSICQQVVTLLCSAAYAEAQMVEKQEAYKKTREGKLLIVLLKLHVLSNMRPDQANKYFLKLEKEIANYFIVFTLAC